MSNTQFTPGPWRQDPINYNRIEKLVTGKNGYHHPITLVVKQSEYNRITEKESIANANLIAAAPDTYNELVINQRNMQILIDMLTGARKKDSKEIIAISEQMAKADAALNKANGKP